MPRLLLPGRALAQPQSGFEIDRGNPITRDLQSVIVNAGGRLVDVLTGVRPTSPGSLPDPGTGRDKGRSFRTFDAPQFSGRRAHFTDPRYVSVGPNKGVTEFGLLRITAALSDWGSFWGTGDPSADPMTLMRRNSSSNNIVFSVIDSGSGWDAVSSNSELLTVADGNWHTLLGTAATGAGPRLDLDGVTVGSDPAGGSAGALSTGRLSLFRAWNDSDDSAGQMGLFLRWLRPLSIAESRSLRLNPWQVLRAPARRLFVVAPSGGAFTLSAGAGSYTLTGAAAGLKVSRKITAAQGSFALTGNAATLKRGRVIPAAAGAFALAGNAASLRATRRLAAGGGAFAFTGQPAALRYGRRLAAAVGAFALTGNSAGLIVARRLGAGTGAYSLSGMAAGLVKQGAQRLVADAGAFTLAGHAAVLRRAARVGAGAGAFALTGVDAALRRLFALSAGAGAYAWAGQPAALRRTYVLAAGPGSFGFTGNIATLTYSSAPAPIVLGALTSNRRAVQTRVRANVQTRSR